MFKGNKKNNRTTSFKHILHRFLVCFFFVEIEQVNATWDFEKVNFSWFNRKSEFAIISKKLKLVKSRTS